MQVALLYTFRYFDVGTMLIVLYADTFNSPQDMQRSSLDIAYEHVNFMWTLDLSRVQLAVSILSSIYGRYVLIMSLPVSANLSDTG